MNKKILIASVLKPVNDARMYEKIGISLSQLPGYEIHIAGQAGPVNPTSNIHIHPIFRFSRLSFKRFMAPLNLYKLLIKVKPQYVIVTTHELLIVTFIYKILFGGKIIYDVQENYFRNIAYTSTFPPIIRHLLALGVRAMEVLSRPFISHYFLAEKNYEKEFSFSKGKSSILENKLRKSSVLPSRPEPVGQKIKLLYSGTIAENYGIFEAIGLAIELHKLAPRIELTIIGYCAINQTLNKVKESIKPYPFIKLIGGESLIPHQEILVEIAKSHFGLVSYRPNKSTINCIPTKVYEYLAFRLPMIVQKNPIWEELIRHYGAGMVTDFSQPDPGKILAGMTKETFYQAELSQDLFWEEEELKLLKVLSDIS